MLALDPSMRRETSPRLKWARRKKGKKKPDDGYGVLRSIYIDRQYICDGEPGHGVKSRNAKLIKKKWVGAFPPVSPISLSLFLSLSFSLIRGKSRERRCIVKRVLG